MVLRQQKIVIDNSRNMKAAWGKGALVYLSILSSGCAAYTMNLLMSDVSKLFPVNYVVSNAVILSKFIKRQLSLFQ